MRVRNAVFSILLCVLMAGPLTLFGAQELAKADLPSWLSSEDAIQLAGGVDAESVEDNLSVEGFRQGALQSAMAGVMENHIPLKAAALSGRMAFQRQLIDMSQRLFGYDITPTEVGSDYLYYKDIDAVSYIPVGLAPHEKRGMQQFIADVEGFAERHPDVDVVVYVVGGYQNPAASALYEIDPSCDFKGIMELCSESMKDAPDNLYLLGSEYDSVEEYYRDFFHTDHHWNARGIMKAYGQIADVLDMPAIEIEGETYFDEYRFSGSLGRATLYDIEEIPFDLDIDYSNLRIVDANGNYLRSAAHDSWASREPGLIRDFYTCYYEDLGGRIIEGGLGDRNVCLVSNSYGGGMQRPLAQGSASFRGFYDLHPAFPSHTTLDARYDALSFDTVIFVASPKDYVSFGLYSSAYFE